MRLLVDECCPRPLVVALRDDGHDVRHVLESGPGATDAEVARMAVEEGRIIVTEDYDFGEMAIRSQAQLPGVILLGMGAKPVAERIARLRQVIKQASGSFAGHLAVVEASRLRLRPLALSL